MTPPLNSIYTTVIAVWTCSAAATPCQSLTYVAGRIDVQQIKLSQYLCLSGSLLYTYLYCRVLCCVQKSSVLRNEQRYVHKYIYNGVSHTTLEPLFCDAEYIEYSTDQHTYLME